MREHFQDLWKTLYTGVVPESEWRAACDESWDRIVSLASDLERDRRENPWYENLVVYALYPQHFNRDIPGITAKLDHLEKLGINCLWLLPMLDSPMRDEGFDISDYRKIRSDLFPADFDSDDRDRAFAHFISVARERGISVIFDIALNHVSSDHRWFSEARDNTDSPYRDYFIWSDTGKEYDKARIIFKGLLDSNWTRESESGQFYLHRFYPHQPDINYRNPRVLSEMIGVLLYWVERGIRGFRVDAAPYLWKEEGTDCENLPGTHQIIRIIRFAMEQLPSDLLLLAEACQPPKEVVNYFGAGDECQGAYHFPLMPRLYRAILQRDSRIVEDVLSPGVTPEIPAGSRWFTFLRCHDELTLEMVTPEERTFLHGALCKDPAWDFRSGEGISARLAELFEDPGDVLFAHLLLLGMRGNPVIYYGDEFLIGNNREYAAKQREYTGFDDSRNLVRGPLDWPSIDELLARASGIEDGEDGDPRGWHLEQLSRAIHLRRNAAIFSGEESLSSAIGGAILEIRKTGETGGGDGTPPFILRYNLSDREQEVETQNGDGDYVRYLYWNGAIGEEIQSGDRARETETGPLPPRGVLWLIRKPLP